LFFLFSTLTVYKAKGSPKQWYYHVFEELFCVSLYRVFHNIILVVDNKNQLNAKNYKTIICRFYGISLNCYKSSIKISFVMQVTYGLQPQDYDNDIFSKEDKKMKKANLLLIGLLTVVGIILAGCGSTTNNKGTVNAKAETKTATDSKENKESSEANKYYFTANEGGTISKVNVTDNEVVATIEAEGIVHNVQVSPDGKIIGATLVPKMENDHGDYHGDSHGMDMTGKALFYDTNSNELINTVDVGNHPAHIVFTNDGKYALVTNNEDNTVSVIEMNSYSVVNTISTGKGPHGFRISNDNKYAYIANMGADSVSVINLETMSEEKQIKVGNTPVTTGITTDGKTLVITLNAENALGIVNLETDEVSKVEVGKGPAQLYIDSSNQFAYVANQGTEDSPSNSLTIVDINNKTVTATVETGKGSHGVVASSDNKYVYVTNMFEDTISVIDPSTKKVVKTVKVGETPNGISVMN
jgi:YVTN family beta-propeller protein